MDKLQKELQQLVNGQKQLDITEIPLNLAQKQLQKLTENLQKIPSLNNEEQEKIADIQRELQNLADQERQDQERFTRAEVQLAGAQVDLTDAQDHLDTAKEDINEFLN